MRNKANTRENLWGWVVFLSCYCWDWLREDVSIVSRKVVFPLRTVLPNILSH